jgi:TolA-binding protein
MLKKNILAMAFVCGVSGSVWAQQTPGERHDDRLYLRGLELLDKSKYAAARQTFQEYISLNRNDLKSIDAEYYVAYSALNLFNADAEVRFENFARKYPEHPKAATANYELGNFYYNQRKYDKAIQFFNKVDSKTLSKEQAIEADFKLGYSHFTRKEFEKAGKAFNKIKGSQHKYTGAANYYAGYVAFLNENFDEALADLARAERDPAYKNMVPVMVTGIYYRQGLYDKVISYGEQALSQKGTNDTGEIALLIAEAHFRKEDYSKAAQNFNRYATENKSSVTPAVHYRIGYANYMANASDKAIEHFKQVAAKDDTLGQNAAYHLGLAYLKADNKQFASSAFEQAARKNYDPKIKQLAMLNQGKVNYDMGKYRETIPVMKALMTEFPNSEVNAEANDVLSEAYLNTDNYDEAIAHIEKMNKRSKRVNAAYQRVTFQKGVKLFNDSRFQEAVEMFEKSAKSPEDAETQIAAHFWAGEAYSVMERYPEAANSYAAVFRAPNASRSPYFLKARYGIGYAYYNQKDFEKAQVHFREYVTALERADNKQNWGDALVRLGDTYFVTKRYNEALRLYDRAIEANIADRDYAYFQKGVVLTLNKRPEEARNAFNVVIDRFPTSRFRDDALYQKAQLEFQNGTFASAISGFSTLIQNYPNSTLAPNAHLKRGVAYSNLKDYDNAARDYKKILNEYPTHKTANSALLGLQEVMAATNRIEDFNDYLTRYKQANPDGDALESIEFETAKSLYFAQKYPQAIRSFENYLRTYPNNNMTYDARFYLGESFYRLNDMPNALKHHTDVIREGKSTMLSRSVGRAAEIEFAGKNYRNSINLYRRLANVARNKKEQSNAWIGLVENYFLTAQYDSVGYFANEVINSGGATIEAQNRALLYSGKSAYAQGNLAKATDDFLNTVNSAKDQNGAEAQYLMAEIQYKQNNYKQSLETLYDLNKSFAGYAAWIDKSFLLIADNFIALNENFQAEATLKSIIEKSPDPQTRETAKTKLSTLQGKKSAATSSTQNP